MVVMIPHPIVLPDELQIRAVEDTVLHCDASAAIRGSCSGCNSDSNNKLIEINGLRFWKMQRSAGYHPVIPPLTTPQFSAAKCHHALVNHLQLRKYNMAL